MGSGDSIVIYCIFIGFSFSTGKLKGSELFVDEAEASSGRELIKKETGIKLINYTASRFVKLKEMAEWVTLDWPDIDSWDWEDNAQEYRKTLDLRSSNRGIMITGMFERMISLLDFAKAATATIQEPKSVIAFME